MKQRDIAVLMDAIAPVIVGVISKAMLPLLARVEKAEADLIDLQKPPLSPEDIEALTTAAYVKVLAVLSKASPTVEDVATLADANNQLNNMLVELRSSLPDLIGNAVAALPKAPTAEEVAALVPAPKDGRDGAPGAEGAPGKPGADGQEGVSGQDGAPGAPGRDGGEGARGVDGIAGKDGIGLAGALIDNEGALAITLTDGTIAKLGRVVGKDGGQGADGLGFEDMEMVDEGTEVVFRFSQGARVKEFRVAKPTLADFYRGVWKVGPYKKGDAVTWGGSLFIAQADTETKPETGEDWKLAVKRGRDGKDGVAIEQRGVTKVKL